MAAALYSSKPGFAFAFAAFFFCLVSLMMVSVESGLEFHVGGSRGWVVPPGNETESYNHWAMENRFHVGDSVYFKYKEDSVLIVDREAYHQCNTTEPLLEFSDGNTTFQFDRYGFFYFISGTPGHCEEGQRLIIRVMVHPEVAATSPAPAPGLHSGGGGYGDPGSTVSEPLGPKASAAAMAKASFFAVLPVLGAGLLFV